MTSQIRHALTWSFLGELASRTLSPLVLLVLVRFLAPADFGVLTAALAIVSFSQLFCDAGLASALIQRQDRPEDAANAVFWMNTAFASAVFVLLVAFASQIGAFFDDARVVPVVQVLSIQVVLAAMGSVHTALLQKRLDFKQLFWIRLIAAGGPASASIPLAMQGAGHWALVAGALAGQLIQTLVLWKLSNWRPGWKIDIQLARQLLSFGKWTMLSGILGWCYGWLDTIVVGHYLGPHEMGLYRTGSTFVGVIFGLAFSPVLPVLYSFLSRTQNDLPRLRTAFNTVIHGIVLIALPGACFLFVFGEPIGQLLFGPRWHGIGEVIAFLGLMHGLSWIVGANGEAYRAIGKPYAETWVNGGMLVFYLVTYLLCIRLGFHAFLIARVGLACVALLVHMKVANRILSLSIWSRAYLGILVTSVAAGIAVQWAMPNGEWSLSEFVLSSLLFATVISAGLAMFEHAFLRQLLVAARQKR